MSADEDVPSSRDRASPVAIALTQWQHAAGDYWPFVCAAPFVSATWWPGNSSDPAHATDRRMAHGRVPPAAEPGIVREPRHEPALYRPPPLLAKAVNAVRLGKPVVLFVDLPVTSVLPATEWLNQSGFVVVPVIQRWVVESAVLKSRRLVEQLIDYGGRCQRPVVTSGVIFVLDGERAGRRRVPGPIDIFDNRYGYSPSRFPSAEDLVRRGVSDVQWVSASEVASDLRPYVASLVDAGLRVLGVDRPTELGATITPTQGKRGMNPQREWDVPGLDLSKEAGETGRPGLYRRFVRRAQTRALLSDHLVDGEPYLAPDALFLSSTDDTTLRELTGTFVRAFDRAARILARDVPGLEGMGFPWVGAELLHAEEPHVPLIGRFDFARDVRGHWWLLEFNADTPSGVREAIGVEEALVKTYPTLAMFARPNSGLGQALVDAFVAATRDRPMNGALGLVTNASELEDLSQMAFTQRLLADTMTENGISVVLGDIDNLRLSRSDLRLGGQRLGALYRYFPFETSFGTSAFAAIYDAVTNRQVHLLNGLFGLLLQHKGILAWLWAHRHDPQLPADERRAIERHLPPTWNVADWTGGSRHDGDPAGSDVVVKQVFGREGEEVFLGEGLSAADWAAFRQRRTYVVQRRVEVGPVDALISTSAGPRRCSGFATVGSFAVSGAWAGYYTRFGGRIMTSRATWLATLVRSASR